MRAIAWICITVSIATSICLIVKKPSLVTPWIIFLISCVQADLFIFSKNENSTTSSSNQNKNNSDTEKQQVETKQTNSKWTIAKSVFGFFLILISVFLFVFLLDKRIKKVSLAKFQ